MKFKKLFLVICIVICLFTMASVSAGEVNDTVMTAADLQDNSEINEDNQVTDEMDNPISAVDSTNKDDNIPALGTSEKSDLNKLGETDDNLIGDDLKADVTALNVSVADNTVFVVDCSDDFNGNVLIKMGNHTLYDGSVKTLIKAVPLPAGNHVATAVFYGDSKYESLTLNNIGFSVSRVTPTINVDIDDVTYNSTAYANVHIGNNANGTVYVTVDKKKFNKTVFNGHANVSLSGLSAGYKDAKIEFFSTDYYNNNVNSSAKFIVYPNNSLVEINGGDIFYVGEDIELKVNTINSTGDLTIYINGKMYGGPLYYTPERIYDVVISDKLEGSYVIECRLDRDENYTGYTTSKTVSVVKKNLAINVDIFESIRVGSPITITAKLNETVSGNVTFTINGANYTEHVDNDDEVTHLYTPVNNDTLTVVATFMGNEMYNSGASDSRDFNVDRIATNVDVNFSPIIAGDDAVIKVAMNPEINGAVILYVNDKSYDVAIVEGSGVYTVSNLANATYNVQAIFVGDDKYAGSSSEVKHLSVNKVITDLNIYINKDSMSYHDFAVVSVVLDQSINAIVTVKVNGTNNTVGLVNGKGSFTLNDLHKGNYVISAVFAGDDRYVDCTSNTVNLEVTGDNISSSVSISLNRNSVIVGDEVIVTVNSNPTVTGVIRLNIGSGSYNVAVNKGVGTFTISDLANGTYDVWAVFDGDDKHIGNTSDVKRLEVNRIPTNLTLSLDNPSIFVGDSVVVGVVLNQPINNVVTVNFNGKDYLIGIVNGKGNLTLSGLAFGTYTVNATFAGEGKYVESTSDNATLIVNKIKTQLAGNPVTTVYNGDEYLVVTLKDSKGNAIANADVTVNLNGVNTLRTDSKGQLKVSTNGLAPNAYTAKIIFKGNAVYDESSKDIKVTVKKATSKIVAGAKVFKVKQTKKYTVTLKSGKKPISKMGLTLKIGKKTYSATTNAKGQATFNLKLAKGTFKPVVRFAANKYYNGATAKTTIIVK